MELLAGFVFCLLPEETVCCAGRPREFECFLVTIVLMGRNKLNTLLRRSIHVFSVQPSQNQISTTPPPRHLGLHLLGYSKSVVWDIMTSHYDASWFGSRELQLTRDDTNHLEASDWIIYVMRIFNRVSRKVVEVTDGTIKKTQYPQGISKFRSNVVRRAVR